MHARNLMFLSLTFFFSSKAFAQWREIPVNGETGLDILSFHIDNRDPWTITVNLSASRPLRSKDGGRSWSPLFAERPEEEIRHIGQDWKDRLVEYFLLIHSTTAGLTYGSSQSVRKSIDGGVTLQSDSLPPLWNFQTIGHQAGIVVGLFTGLYGPYGFIPLFIPRSESFPAALALSRDGGVTWEKSDPRRFLRNVLTSNTAEARCGDYFFDQDIISDDRGRVFLNVRQVLGCPSAPFNKMVYTTDAGQTWVELWKSAPRYWWNVDSLGSFSGMVLKEKGDTSVLYVAAQKGLRRTIVETKEIFDTYLPSRSLITEITTSPLNDDIYVGTDGDGIWRSKDFAASWEKIENALDGKIIRQIAIGKDGTIYTGTSSGFYVKAATGPTSADNGTVLPTSFALFQNYPNPFNPATEIRYQISEVSHVTLKVYDVLGREVATLVNGEREAGTHRVPWEATGVPSGVYVYRLLSNGFAGTRKLMLVR